MDLGVTLPTSSVYASTEAIVRTAQEAERLGYTAVWTYERLLYPLESPTQTVGSLPEYYMSTFEPLGTLFYVAAKTSKIRLGTSIINAPFHVPVILARQFATLDQMSGGRAIAGLGQGWIEQEFITANTSFKQRGRAVEEFVTAMRAAWGPDPVQFEGQFYRIPLAKINPKPLQEGGIPVVLGTAHPVAIRRAARLGIGLNPIAFTFEVLEEAMNNFRAALQEEGRDPAGLKVIARANVPITARSLPEGNRPFLGGSAAQIAKDLARVKALGFDHVLFADLASSTVDEAVLRLEELRDAAHDYF